MIVIPLRFHMLRPWWFDTNPLTWSGLGPIRNHWLSDVVRLQLLSENRFLSAGAIQLKSSSKFAGGYAASNVQQGE